MLKGAYSVQGSSLKFWGVGSVAMRWTREGEKLEAGIFVFGDKRDGDHHAPFCEVQEVSGKMVVCYNSCYYG